ncbi:MAG: hypothetical protein ACLRX3_03695 [Subdoligranulum sp.]
MATLEPSERNAVIEWLAQTELQPLFDGLDYINNGPHSYVDSAPAGHITWQTVQLDGTAAFGGNRYKIKKTDWRAVDVEKIDIDDPDEVLAKTTITLADMYSKARALYIDKTAKTKKQSAAKQAAAETRRKKALHKKAMEILADYDNWHKIAQAKELGIVFREYPLQDGGRVIVMVDEKSKREYPPTQGMPYNTWEAIRYNAEGERVVFATGDKESIEGIVYRTCWGQHDLESLLMKELEQAGG